ncbi:MAG: hypothetical protein IIY04_01450, partial [Oscillospiraceae bacterium]|nr:hypothetical protein [Oscillospiraceae bacterium]
VKKIAEKFSKAAEQKLSVVTDPEARKNLELIRDTAARIPWNKPETFYEGLNTMSFMKRVLGSLEGVGFHSMGRADVLLKDLYAKAISEGQTEEELYDLACKYMITWDAYMDHEEITDGYGNYEYECSIVVGGCDENGNEVFNDVTRILLRAHEELTAVYPKIHCRYSSKSSEEYLTLIGSSIIHGKSTLMFNNDDSAIAALVRSGIALEDARDYVIGGCWDCLIPKLGKRAAGEYFNILKVLELTVNMPQDQLDDNELEFEGIEQAQSFEEVYDIFMRNVKYLAHRKAEAECWGSRMWSQVTPICLNSALMRRCLDVRKDLTANGQVMNKEGIDFSGTPDVIDSLLAIKTLVYEEKRCTLQDIIYQCRNNWPNEALRQAAINAPSYGDGSDVAAEFSGKFNNDLYEITMGLPTAFGEGHYHMGHFMYTEIIWWGKDIKATPNGRVDGDYMSHGLTPSRLHEIKSVTDVFVGLRKVDFSTLASTSIMNIILPMANMTSEILNDFFRASAKSGVQALQINCVSKELLLEAQKHPEQHKDIIVRVCGFSSPFVMLSPEFQAEFLSRNYYES